MKLKNFYFPSTIDHDAVVVMQAKGLKHAKAVAVDQGYSLGNTVLAGDMVTGNRGDYDDMPTVLIAYELEY